MGGDQADGGNPIHSGPPAAGTRGSPQNCKVEGPERGNLQEASFELNLGVLEVFMDTRGPVTSRDGLGQEEPPTQCAHTLFFPIPGVLISKPWPDGGESCEEEEDAPGQPDR